MTIEKLIHDFDSLPIGNRIVIMHMVKVCKIFQSQKVLKVENFLGLCKEIWGFAEKHEVELIEQFIDEKMKLLREEFEVKNEMD